jgi:phosphoribosylamine--glycine ligase
LDLFERVASGTLAGADARTGTGSAACVVLAAAGYPGPYSSGAPISGLDRVPPDVLAFHAGTTLSADGSVVAAGGRVLGIVGRGQDLSTALEKAYAGATAIRFEGMQYRRDIGRRGLADR